MNQFLYFIDRLSAWVGKSFAWCILILTFATTYEVFVRYVLRAPTSWAFDISYIMYGTLFMMGGREMPMFGAISSTGYGLRVSRRESSLFFIFSSFSLVFWP